MNDFESTSLSEDNPENTHESEVRQDHDNLENSTDEKQESSAREESSKKPTAKMLAFQAELDSLSGSEEKLQHAVSRMESALAQAGNPDFRTFWDIRKVCLDLFKENPNSPLRLILWNKYTELSKEARRLKEILDEQSAFAAEQIEIAIQGIEKELTDNEQFLQEFPEPDFIIDTPIFKAKRPFYQHIQKELNLLNAQASRINALRKELIKTEMRVRQKNKFFQRLSEAGDKVFPRRKQLIKEVSDQFLNDVNQFIDDHFKASISEHSLFNLREEIKALQGFAKILTLNTFAFTTSRTSLSTCWDEIKKLEKERKKERSAQRETFKQNTEVILAKIQEFNQAFDSGLSVTDALKQIDEITSQMRDVELGRFELKTLRDELQNSRKKIQEKQKLEEEERISRTQEKDRLKRNLITQFKTEIDSLVKSAQTKTPEEIEGERDQFLQKISEAGFAKSEKQELERLLKPLRDIVAEMRENALLVLSEDDKQAMQQLKEVLKQKQERRKEVKEQLEILRKISNSSGFDIAQSMNTNMKITEEKERLEKINSSIAEIEEKITQLKRSSK